MLCLIWKCHSMLSWLTLLSSHTLLNSCHSGFNSYAKGTVNFIFTNLMDNFLVFIIHDVFAISHDWCPFPFPGILFCHTVLSRFPLTSLSFIFRMLCSLCSITQPIDFGVLKIQPWLPCSFHTVITSKYDFNFPPYALLNKKFASRPLHTEFWSYLLFSCPLNTVWML